MTKPKEEPVLVKMQRLKDLGKKFLNGKPPTEEELKYVGNVFVLIGDGADPYDVLNIKGTGGWNSKKSKEEQERLNRLRLAIAWIEQAMKPEPDGFGYDFERAVGKIAEDYSDPPHFGLTEDNLRRIWNRHKELRGKPLTLLDLELLD